MATQRKSNRSSGGSGGNGSAPKQSSRSQAQARGREQQGDGSGGEPDVVLDVPQLKVEEIGLEVDNLHARIALETKLGDLLHLHVGADVVVDRVALDIKGVDAQAQLTARLHNVLSILDRTLQSVDKNPEVLTDLARVAEAVPDAVKEEIEAGSKS